jgi:hypothetical protein
MLSNGEFPLLPEVFEPDCVWGARVGGDRVMIRRFDIDRSEAVFLIFGFICIGFLVGCAL